MSDEELVQTFVEEFGRRGDPAKTTQNEES